MSIDYLNPTHHAPKGTPLSSPCLKDRGFQRRTSVNSDWHDYRGTGKDEDRLLKPGWLEQLLVRWGLDVAGAPDEDTIANFKSLRSLMQRMVQAFLRKQAPTEQDIAALNSYLDAAPSKLHLVRAEGSYQLQQLPLQNDWHCVGRGRRLIR